MRFHDLVAKSLGHEDLRAMNEYIDTNFKDARGNFTQAYYETSESKFTFDGKDGLWARISKRFAMETKGEVRIMTVNPGEHSVLVNTEIEALLENKKITSIDGSSIDEIMASGNPKSYIIANAAYRTILSNPSEKEYAYWLKMADDKVYQQALDNSDAATRQRIRDAHREITEKFGRPVSEEVTQKVRDTLDNGNNPGASDGGHPGTGGENNPGTGGGSNPGTGGGNNPGAGGGNNPGTGGGNNPGTGSNPPDIKGGKALPVIGWGFTLLAALSVSEEARAAEEAGDPERAKEIWAEFAVGELGGEIAGTVGGGSRWFGCSYRFWSFCPCRSGGRSRRRHCRRSLWRGFCQRVISAHEGYGRQSAHGFARQDGDLCVWSGFPAARNPRSASGGSSGAPCGNVRCRAGGKGENGYRLPLCAARIDAGGGGRGKGRRFRAFQSGRDAEFI